MSAQPHTLPPAPETPAPTTGIKRFLWAFLSVAVLAGAGSLASLLYATRPEAAEIEREKPIVEVEVLRAHPRDNPVTIAAMGEVMAAQQLALLPEVGGRVRARKDGLVPGGLVHADDVLVKIDTRDYAAVLAAQKAAIAQAKVQIADERGRKSVAAAEWKGNLDGLDEESRQFALRDPQMQSASASLQSARQQASKAQRDLSRGTIRAPFDALVLDTPVEVGQVVSQQSPLMTLVATDRYWVSLTVPVAQLDFLDIPTVNTADSLGSPAEILHDAGAGVSIERTGYIERLEGAVDARGRMAKLLVTVPDPLDLGKPAGERSLPLLLGSFVKIALRGRPAKDTVALPREALIDNREVWLVADGALMRHPVEVVWRARDQVLVRGLSEGDAVVTTPLAAPTEGMKVSITSERSEPGAVGREQVLERQGEADGASDTPDGDASEAAPSGDAPEDADEDSSSSSKRAKRARKRASKKRGGADNK
ncbi:MAG: efflux RND transporter periplasmic adaptor subunit [Myxococcales bacterium]|nr:efflux RND transporter periplasmic adaptor subunit [Myxococcales bacterium]